MSRKKIVIVVVALLFISLLVGIIFSSNIDNKNLDGERFKDEYEKYNGEIVRGDLIYPEVNISKDNIIKYSSVDEILEIFNNNKDAVVYIGYPSCLYCRTAVQVLLDTAKSTELDVIYYIDIEKIWFEMELNEENEAITVKEASEEYYKLTELLDDKFIKDYTILNANFKNIDTGKDRLEVPLVLFVANGDIVSYNQGTLPSQLDPLISFDKSQTEGLSQIYNNGINDVLSSMKIEEENLK